MACKHFGGKDPCDRNKHHQCKSWSKYSNSQRAIRISPSSRSGSSDRGTAAEYYVMFHCLSKELLLGQPCNRASEHDLFVKAGGKWRTVQVKTGRVNKTNGHIWTRGTSGIRSDLAAFVDLEGKRIRWVSYTDEPVPKELL